MSLHIFFVRCQVIKPVFLVALLPVSAEVSLMRPQFDDQIKKLLLIENTIMAIFFNSSGCVSAGDFFYEFFPTHHCRNSPVGYAGWRQQSSVNYVPAGDNPRHPLGTPNFGYTRPDKCVLKYNIISKKISSAYLPHLH